MNAGVWDEVATQLARQFRVHSVDLPGYGQSPRMRALHAGCDCRHGWPPTARRASTVCGWSLGGQLALRWALSRPAQIERLILIATTPRFVQDPGWDSGMELRYSTHLRAISRTMRTARCSDSYCCRRTATRTRAAWRAGCAQCLPAREATGAATLAAGLQILKDTDLRCRFATNYAARPDIAWRPRYRRAAGRRRHICSALCRAPTLEVHRRAPRTRRSSGRRRTLRGASSEFCHG